MTSSLPDVKRDTVRGFGEFDMGSPESREQLPSRRQRTEASAPHQQAGEQHERQEDDDDGQQQEPDEEQRNPKPESASLLAVFQGQHERNHFCASNSWM